MPAAATGCSTALGALLSIAISGTVKTSTMTGVEVGTDFTVSLLAEPTALYRMIEGQGLVQDGISPHKACDLEVSFSSGLKAHYTAPADPTLGLYFSVEKGRVVYDGAWVSEDPVDGSAGLPLDFHEGDTLFGGVFDITFARGSIPSLTLTECVGSLGKSALVDATLDIWKGWSSNTVISADLKELVISKAPVIEK